MACIAGRLMKIEVSEDGGSSWENLGGLVDATLNLNIDELECTSHDDNGARSYIPNHHDATVDFSSRYDEADDGQDIIIDAAFAKTVLDFRVYMQVSSGLRRFDAEGFATSLAMAGPLDDTANLDGTIRLSGLTATTQP